MARLILKRNDVKLVHGDPTISPAGALAHNPAVIQRWDSVALAPRINKRRKGNGGGESLNGKDLVRNECQEEREGWRSEARERLGMGGDSKARVM